MNSAFALTPAYEKWKTNGIVCLAVKRGELIRQPCNVCGESKALAHHEDYLKPLEVVWLCPKHHAERHKELRNIHGIKIKRFSYRKGFYFV